MTSDGRTERALTRGLLAGVAGTAVMTTVMTAVQTVYDKAMDAEPSSTPAEVAKRVIRGVLQRDVSDEHIDTLDDVVHRPYGTGWGTLYGLASRRTALGVAFGSSVWGASLVELPAMQLSPPVRKLAPSSIAPDLGVHLIYGMAVAVAHRALS